MAALTDAQKLFIVGQLACFRTPTEVAEDLVEEFGIELARQRAHYFDPTRSGGDKVAEKWQKIFWATREEYVDAVARVGIAHQRRRLEVLQDLLYRALEMDDSAGSSLALSILRQAAEEVGGRFMNHLLPQPVPEPRDPGGPGLLIEIVPAPKIPEDIEQRCGMPAERLDRRDR